MLWVWTAQVCGHDGDIDDSCGGGVTEDWDGGRGCPERLEISVKNIGWNKKRKYTLWKAPLLRCHPWRCWNGSVFHLLPSWNQTVILIEPWSVESRLNYVFALTKRSSHCVTLCCRCPRWLLVKLKTEIPNWDCSNGINRSKRLERDIEL